MGVHGSKILLPLRGTKTKHNFTCSEFTSAIKSFLLHSFFDLKLTTLRGTETAFLTPKRCDEHPRHIYMGVSPGVRVIEGEIIREMT